ncbi:MAG: 2-oxo acid dehydrogenase subunit E2 [Candidatus Sumerlaeia bacterium]
MTNPIKMPDLPRKAADATVRRWLKQPGDTVEVGEVLLEVEIETGIVEIEASQDGVLESIAADKGKTLKKGDLIGDLSSDSKMAKTSSKTAQKEGNDKMADKKSAASVAQEAVQMIVMPKAGNDMEEGTILEWKVKEGDTIKKGDILFEMETDKATLEVESEFEGPLCRIVAQADDTVPVMEPVAYIADSADTLDAWLKEYGASQAESEEEPADEEAPMAKVQEAPKPAPAAQTAPSAAASDGNGRQKISPAARRLAAEKGIDPASISAGSGAHGRIITDDLQGIQAAPTAASAPVFTPRTEAATRVVMTGMRKAIAKNLTNSVNTAPHFYMKLTIDAGKLLEVYARQKLVCKASINDLLLLAVARTMMKYPPFRCQVHANELLQFPGANIGMAVAVDDGLRVPVITDVDRMSLQHLAGASKDAISKARSGKMVNAGKGAFTISNLGMTQIEEFTAIINPPEAAILAVGKVKDTVKIVPGAMVPAKEMSMWLSSDHRVIDGMVAAQFLGELKKILESPEVLEMEALA